MPQRVLYLLNISNPARLAADSGWIFADLLARRWPAPVSQSPSPPPAGDARSGFARTVVSGTSTGSRLCLAWSHVMRTPNAVFACGVHLVPGADGAGSNTWAAPTGSPPILVWGWALRLC
jgi:hypothetical protein